MIIFVGPYRTKKNDKASSMIYFLNMLQEVAVAGGHEVRTLYPPVVLGNIFPKGMLYKLCGAIDKLIIFPVLLLALSFSFRLKKKAHVFHIVDQAYANYALILWLSPHLVTCHDLNSALASLGRIPERMENRGTLFYQKVLLFSIKKCQKIASVSKTTAANVKILTGRDSEVIYNDMHFSVSPQNPVEIIQGLLFGHDRQCSSITQGRYFMHVGINIWYKNRLGVLKIFNSLSKYERFKDFMLVMVGPPFSKEMTAYVEAGGLKDRVLLLSDVDSKVLSALYRLSAGLIFPSLYEGFGWPIVEAQAHGCPVFTSNRQPMMEVGGEGACYIDPLEPDKAAQAILEALSQQQMLVDTGAENAKRFTSGYMAKGYLGCYRQLLASKGCSGKSACQ